MEDHYKFLKSKIFPNNHSFRLHVGILHLVPSGLIIFDNLTN